MVYYTNWFYDIKLENCARGCQQKLTSTRAKLAFERQPMRGFSARPLVKCKDGADPIEILMDASTPPYPRGSHTGDLVRQPRLLLGFEPWRFGRGWGLVSGRSGCKREPDGLERWFSDRRSEQHRWQSRSGPGRLGRGRTAASRSLHRSQLVSSGHLGECHAGQCQSARFRNRSDRRRSFAAE